MRESLKEPYKALSQIVFNENMQKYEYINDMEHLIIKQFTKHYSKYELIETNEIQSEINKAKSKKRTAKKRWENKIEKEGYLEIAIKEILKKGRFFPIYISVAREIDNSYKEWKMERNEFFSNLDYRIMQNFSFKQVCTAIFIDIELFCIEYINLKNNNVENIEVQSNKVISTDEVAREVITMFGFTIGTPFFNEKKQISDIKKIKSNDSSIVGTRTIVRKDSEETVSLTFEAMNIDGLKAHKTLDIKDLKIISFLMSFMPEQITSPFNTSSFTLKHVQQDIFEGQRTPKIYEGIIERIRNIASYKFHIKRENSDLEVIDDITFSFIDSVRVIRIIDEDMLKPKDIIMEIRLGNQFLANSFKTSFIKLYKDDINKLESPYAQLLSHFIATDRISKKNTSNNLEFSFEINTLVKCIDYQGNPSNKKKIDDMISAFESFRANYFLIENYEFHQGKNFNSSYFTGTYIHQDLIN